MRRRNERPPCRASRDAVLACIDFLPGPMPVSTSSLQAHLSATWSSHVIAGNNTVVVVEASAGEWWVPARSACTSPAVWYFVIGHFRTFAWTAPFLARAASATSACAFVVAVVPDELDASLAESTPGGAFGRVDHGGLARTLGPSPHVPALMRHATRNSFASTSTSPAFAYAVLRRSGAVNVYPAALALGWHAAWAVAEWASQQHGLTPDVSSIVVRTRPDVLLTLSLDVSGLRQYVALGAHGRHLALAQNVKRPSGSNLAQSDVHCIFSYGSFETDIARPLERAGDPRLNPAHAKLWWQRGFASGWGYGRSADVWSSDPYGFGRIDTPDHPSPSHALFPSSAGGGGGGGGGSIVVPSASPMHRCVDRCLCLQGDGTSTACQHPSCLLTVAESLVVRTDACNVHRLESAVVNRTGELLASVQPSCVLRSPLPWPPHQVVPADLFASHVHVRQDAAALAPPRHAPYDLTANVACYCAAEWTPPSTARNLTCSLHERQRGERCFRANATRLGAKPAMSGFYRCTHGVPLRPEADLGGGRVSSAGSATRLTDRASAARVWPPGCGGAGLGRQKVVPLAACIASAALVDL